MQPDFSFDQQQDEEEDRLYFKDCIADIQSFLSDNKESLEGYLTTCEENSLVPDYTGYGTVQNLRTQIKNHLEHYKKILDQSSKDIRSYSRKVSSLNQIYRSMIQLKAPASRMLSWCSTAYNQSIEPAFFHPETIGGAGERFNYDRTEGYQTKRLEKQFCEVLGFDPETVSVLATSSGMSAYSLLENHFTQDILKPGDTIYIPRKLYGETELVMFRNESFFKVVRHNHSDEKQIIDDIKQLRPKIIFLESMQNSLGTELLDVTAILEGLSSIERSDLLHVVIDDALLTGAINPFVYQSDRLNIYYMASAIKYLQLGMDSAYAGILAVSNKQYEHLRRLKGFLGQGLYDHIAWFYPSLNREQFLRRQKRLTRNALLVTKTIQNFESLKGKITPLYPLIDQKEKTENFPFIGALITIKFDTISLECSPQGLKYFYQFVDAILDHLSAQGIPAVNSESFGFSIPRIYVGWCDGIPPFIRIACGDRSNDETLLFAKALCEGIVSNVPLLENINRSSGGISICAV